MRMAALAVLWWCLLSGVTLAQLPPGTPTCAIPCFVEGVAVSPCGTNATCLCLDPVFAVSLEGCVRTSCIVEDTLVVKNATSNACGLPVKDLVAQYSIISHTLTVLVIVFVGVRVVYKRFLTSLGLGADDWVMVAVAVLCIPGTVLNSRLATFGVGRDVWTLTPTQITQFGVALWTATLFYYAFIALLKISILYFYLRIFPNPNFRRIIWATIVFTACYGLTFILAQSFQCWPVSYNWTQWNDRGAFDGQGPGGRCINTIIIARANAVISIALDVWMLLLPLLKVRELNISANKKFAIGSMFAVGTFVTVVSVIRFVYLIQFEDSKNITFDYTALLIWSTVEIATGAICACMPALRLILIRIWPHIFESKHTRQAKYADHNIPPADPSVQHPYRPPSSKTGSPEKRKSASQSSITNLVTRRDTTSNTTWTPRNFSRHPTFQRSLSNSPGGGGGGRLGLERIDSQDDDESTELQPTRKSAAAEALEMTTSGRRGGDSAASVASGADDDIEVQVVHAGPLGKPGA